MTDIVEGDVATDPPEAGLFGAAAVVAGAQDLAKLVEQLRLGRAANHTLAGAVHHGMSPS
jgi:hypothetical protein